MNVAAPIVLALAQVAPVAPPQAAPAVPADWSQLADLRFRRRWADSPELSAFVRTEVTAGRCAAAIVSDGTYTVRVELAVLVAPDGHVRRIVPRAIDCVTVEQYATGIVSRMARDNLVTATLAADTWFCTVITFAWPA